MMDELISKQAMINEINLHVGILYDNPTLVESLKLLVWSLTSVQSWWIPCGERLPKDEEEVIVSVRDDSGDNTLNYSSFGWYACAGDFWVVDDDPCYKVIAWMPLPEPYKEEI